MRAAAHSWRTHCFVLASREMHWLSVDDNSELRTAEAEAAATVEAQEVANRQLYESAIRYQADGAAAAAASCYRELLKHHLVADAVPSASGGSEPPSLQLRFLALRNLSEIEEAAGEAEAALQHLLVAIQISRPADAVLWQRLGSLALATGRRNLARLALEQAVAASPHHQLAYLRLVSLLTELGDQRAVRHLAAEARRRMPHLAPSLGRLQSRQLGRLPALTTAATGEAGEVGEAGEADGESGSELGPDEGIEGDDKRGDERDERESPVDVLPRRKRRRVRPSGADVSVVTLRTLSWAAVAESLLDALGCVQGPPPPDPSDRLPSAAHDSGAAGALVPREPLGPHKERGGPGGVPLLLGRRLVLQLPPPPPPPPPRLPTPPPPPSPSPCLQPEGEAPPAAAEGEGVAVPAASEVGAAGADAAAGAAAGTAAAGAVLAASPADSTSGSAIAICNHICNGSSIAIAGANDVEMAEASLAEASPGGEQRPAEVARAGGGAFPAAAELCEAHPEEESARAAAEAEVAGHAEPPEGTGGEGAGEGLEAGEAEAEAAAGEAEVGAAEAAAEEEEAAGAAAEEEAAAPEAAEAEAPAPPPPPHAKKRKAPADEASRKKLPRASRAKPAAADARESDKAQQPQVAASAADRSRLAETALRSPATLLHRFLPRAASRRQGMDRVGARLHAAADAAGQAGEEAATSGERMSLEAMPPPAPPDRADELESTALPRRIEGEHSAAVGAREEEAVRRWLRSPALRHNSGVLHVGGLLFAHLMMGSGLPGSDDLGLTPLGLDGMCEAARRRLGGALLRLHAALRAMTPAYHHPAACDLPREVAMCEVEVETRLVDMEVHAASHKGAGGAGGVGGDRPEMGGSAELAQAVRRMRALRSQLRLPLLGRAAAAAASSPPTSGPASGPGATPLTRSVTTSAISLEVRISWMLSRAAEAAGDATGSISHLSDCAALLAQLPAAPPPGASPVAAAAADDSEGAGAAAAAPSTAVVLAPPLYAAPRQISVHVVRASSARQRQASLVQGLRDSFGSLHASSPPCINATWRCELHVAKGGAPKGTAPRGGHAACRLRDEAAMEMALLCSNSWAAVQSAAAAAATTLASASRAGLAADPAPSDVPLPSAGQAELAFGWALRMVHTCWIGTCEHYEASAHTPPPPAPPQAAPAAADAPAARGLPASPHVLSTSFAELLERYAEALQYGVEARALAMAAEASAAPVPPAPAASSTAAEPAAEPALSRARALERMLERWMLHLMQGVDAFAGGHLDFGARRGVLTAGACQVRARSSGGTNQLGGDTRHRRARLGGDLVRKRGGGGASLLNSRRN